jgi:flagellar biosynthesis protein FlhF
VRLRLFRAETVAAAMAQMRAELGGDALILGTRRVAGGVEITAGVDIQDDPPAAPLALLPRRAMPVAEPDRVAALAWHGTPEALGRKLRAGPLPFALAAALRFASLPLQRNAKPLLLVGPPGSGKTLTTARLATRLVLAGTMPLIVTADGRRAGAAEQLAAFTRVLGVELLVASQPASLFRALERRNDGAPVLIDGPGTDPFLRTDLESIRALAEAAGAEIVLVMAAGSDAAEASEIAAVYGAAAGARWLVATRLDLARRLGSVLAAAAAGPPLVEFGIGPGAADGLVPATPAALAQRLMQARTTYPMVSELRS